MKKNEQGFVLVTALVLLSVLTLIGVASSYKTVVGIKASKIGVGLDKSLIAAQMGLTQLYWSWSKDDTKAATGQAKKGIEEYKDLKSWIAGVTNVTQPEVYKGNLTPSSMAGAPADADITTANGFKIFTMLDTDVVDTHTWKDPAVYNFPQVAVWMTTFDTNAQAYAYETPVDLNNGEKCDHGCKLVTYALGRSGESKKLLRETQGFLNTKLGGVAAMSNAPKGDTFSALCGTTTSAAAFDGSSNGSAWPADGSGPNGNGRTLLEVTQAPYVLEDAPSGTALASNTEFGQDSMFGFRKGHSSQTGAIFNYTPLLLYSGHGTKEGFKVDWASMKRAPLSTADLPAGQLPARLVNSPMTSEEERLDFFSDADTNLFSIDTYRWAAEQLTCQDPTQNDGEFGNGIYCSKGEKLRQALVKMGYDAFAPVTGRLNIAQWEYNVAHAIPMFGMVRLMLPAVQGLEKKTTKVDGKKVTTYVPEVTTCGGKTIINHIIEGSNSNSSDSQWGDTFAKISALGDYDQVDDTVFSKASDKAALAATGYDGAMPNPDTLLADGITPGQDGIPDGPYAFTRADGAVVDARGTLGTKAKMIVYGSVVIDYFADYDIVGNDTTASATAYNTVFDPDFGERILTPLESPDVYFWANIPLLINPVMPRFGGGAPRAFPTAASQAKPLGSGRNLGTDGLMNMVEAGVGAIKNVNLASPYDGYFPWSEAMFPAPNEMGNIGTMRFMSRDTWSDNPGKLGLVDMANRMGRDTEIKGTAADMADMKTMLGWTNPMGTYDEAEIIRYYYELTKSSVKQTEPMDWPVAPWPGNSFASNFCMGELDCGTNDPAATTWNNNMGDKVHLLFPTGYVHGWKTALAALDINAEEWNTILSGNGTTLRGIADEKGLYDQIVGNCTQFGGAGGAVGDCPMGKPYHPADEGFTNRDFVKGYQDNEDKYFKVTEDPVTKYALMDQEWADLPTTIYSGGLIDIHGHTNMNGIMYTPGPLEWGSGLANYGEVQRDGSGNVKFSTKNGDLRFSNNEPYPLFSNDDALSYVNGSIITGYGMAVGYTSSTATSKYLLVYDLQAVDNVNINGNKYVLRRYDWQQLF